MSAKPIYSEDQYQLLMQASCSTVMQNQLVQVVKSIGEIYRLANLEYAYSSHTKSVDNKICVSFYIRLSAEFEMIVDLVCNDLKIDKKIVVGNYKIKNRLTVLARDCIAGVLRYRYKYSIASISKLMKMSGHASIVHACQKIDEKNLPDLKASTPFQFYEAIKRNHRNYGKVCKKRK